jgi:hypothetical protein
MTEECFFKTIKYERVNLCEYDTFEDVVTKLPYFLDEVYVYSKYSFNFRLLLGWRNFLRALASI